MLLLLFFKLVCHLLVLNDVGQTTIYINVVRLKLLFYASEHQVCMKQTSTVYMSAGNDAEGTAYDTKRHLWILGQV